MIDYIRRKSPTHVPVPKDTTIGGTQVLPVGRLHIMFSSTRQVADDLSLILTCLASKTNSGRRCYCGVPGCNARATLRVGRVTRRVKPVESTWRR